MLALGLLVTGGTAASRTADLGARPVASSLIQYGGNQAPIGTAGVAGETDANEGTDGTAGTDGTGRSTPATAVPGSEGYRRALPSLGVGRLPFTGYSAGLLLLAGGALVLTGLAVRRTTRREHAPSPPG